MDILNNLLSLKFGKVLFEKYEMITQSYKLLIPSSKVYQLLLRFHLNRCESLIKQLKQIHVE